MNINTSGLDSLYHWCQLPIAGELIPSTCNLHSYNVYCIYTATWYWVKIVNPIEVLCGPLIVATCCCRLFTKLLT